MAGPLKGIRVVDISQILAGPYCSQVLGDLGAEIIWIEQPVFGGGHRSPPGEPVNVPNYKGQPYIFTAFRRNKKSAVLDLKTSSGKQAVYDLIKVSDVVLDNYRPGVLERLGFDYETIKKVNPKIVSCSITGWGASGPYAHRPALDVVMQGYAGFLSITGEPNGPPIKPGDGGGDCWTGLFAAAGVLSALYKRGVTGEGSRVEVSLLASIMAMMNYNFQWFFLSGENPTPMGTQHIGGVPYGAYKTRDGYIVITGGWPKLARLIGKPWMADDPRFKTGAARHDHRQEFVEELEEALSHKDTDEWLKMFYAEDLIVGPVNKISQVVEDPQVKHEKIIIDVESPLGGKMKMVGCPIKAADISPHDYLAPPILGQHTDEVLTSILHYSPEQINKIKEDIEANTAVREERRTRSTR